MDMNDYQEQARQDEGNAINSQGNYMT